jgi:hypothetical protein
MRLYTYSFFEHSTDMDGINEMSEHSTVPIWLYSYCNYFLHLNWYNWQLFQPNGFQLPHICHHTVAFPQLTTEI